MVMAGAGGVNHEDLCQLTTKHFGKISNEVSLEMTPNVHCRYTGSDMRFRDDGMPLAHVALAVEGVGWTHPDNIPLMIANTIVGSWDRTSGGAGNNASRLAKYCQQNKWCSSFQSFNTCYKVSEEREIFCSESGLASE